MQHQNVTTTEDEILQPRIAAILGVQQNIMTLSWHMPVSRSPFRYAIAVREENYSHALLTASQSFTLNFLPATFMQAIDDAGRVHGNETDKLALTGLKTGRTDAFGNVTLVQSLFHYECKLYETECWGDHTIFIGDVVQTHIHKANQGDVALFLGKGRYGAIANVTQLPKHNALALSLHP